MNYVKKERCKYLVIKQEKLDEYFSQYVKGLFATQEEQETIAKIPFFQVLHAVKNNNEYVVCNQDEPYAYKVWDVILKGERKKLRKKP